MEDDGEHEICTGTAAMHRIPPGLAIFFLIACGDASSNDDDTSTSDGATTGAATNTAGNPGTTPGTTSDAPATSDDPATTQSTSATGGSPSTSDATDSGANDTDAGTTGDTGEPVDPDAVSDEFDDPATLSDWNLLDQVLGIDAPYSVLDIDATAEGKLAITPRVSVWYMDEVATYVYKETSGDFLVEVDVGAYTLNTHVPPTAIYNSAGILLRDPASVGGDQNWLVYNIGYQAEFVGLEGKATRDSVSELILVPTGGVSEAKLRMCRVDGSVHLLRQLPGEDSWLETHTLPGSFATDLTLPDVVQVGMIANAYTIADMHAEFDYIRVRAVSSMEECSGDAP